MEEAQEVPEDDDPSGLSRPGSPSDLGQDEQMAIGVENGGQVRPQLEMVQTSTCSLS